MDSTDTVYIYGLVDPIDGLIHYVGQSRNPYARFSGHLTEARASDGGNRRKNRWIGDLLEIGLEPSIRILAKADESTWAVIESAWIERLWDERAPIVNTRLGGEPSPPHDERWRAGIARRVKTAQQLDDLRKRNRRTAEERTHCKNGHPYDAENTIWVNARDGYTYRSCRICRVAAAVRHHENRKARTVRQPRTPNTHCKSGHPLDEENTYVDPIGMRSCRICKSARSRKYGERKKAARKASKST